MLDEEVETVIQRFIDSYSYYLKRERLRIVDLSSGRYQMPADA
jgi:hypothetical protein